MPVFLQTFTLKTKPLTRSELAKQQSADAQLVSKVEEQERAVETLSTEVGRLRGDLADAREARDRLAGEGGDVSRRCQALFGEVERERGLRREAEEGLSKAGGRLRELESEVNSLEMANTRLSAELSACQESLAREEEEGKIALDRALDRAMVNAEKEVAKIKAEAEDEVDRLCKALEEAKGELVDANFKYMQMQDETNAKMARLRSEWEVEKISMSELKGQVRIS